MAASEARSREIALGTHRFKPLTAEVRSVKFSSLAYRERPGLMCGDEMGAHGGVRHKGKTRV